MYNDVIIHSKVNRIVQTKNASNQESFVIKQNLANLKSDTSYTKSTTGNALSLFLQFRQGSQKKKNIIPSELPTIQSISVVSCIDEPNTGRPTLIATHEIQKVPSHNQMFCLKYSVSRPFPQMSFIYHNKFF